MELAAASVTWFCILGVLIPQPDLTWQDFWNRLPAEDDRKVWRLREDFHAWLSSGGEQHQQLKKYWTKNLKIQTTILCKSENIYAILKKISLIVANIMVGGKRGGFRRISQPSAGCWKILECGEKGSISWAQIDTRFCGWQAPGFTR